MAALDSLEIFLITVIMIVAVISIVVCCSAACVLCCGGGSPLCCWATALIACFGFGQPHGPRYQEIATTTTIIIPPPPSVVYATAVDASAPPPMAVAEGVAVHTDQQQQKEKGVVQGYPVRGSAPPAPASYQGGSSGPSTVPSTLDVPPPPKSTSPRDVWALVLFFFNVCFLTALAIRLGLPSLGLWEHELSEKSHIPTTYSPQAVAASQNLLYLCLGLAVAGDLLAMAWLHVMLQWASGLIESTIWCTIAGASILALFSLTLGHLVGFFIFALLAMAGICLLYEERSKIFLSSANLGTACRALLDHTKVLGVAYLVLLVQLLWAVLWSLAALGVYAYMSQENHSHTYRKQAAGENTVLLIFLALSLYWGSQICENVLRCTVVGVVASWWYTPEVKDPVGPALARAAGPSLGSICVGSLLVSVVEGTRALVRSLMRSRLIGCCGGCVIDYVLACVEGLWRTFNRFAFVFVGVWGYAYCDAAHLALQLFEAKGWDVVLNDYLIGNVLFLGSFLVGGITASIGVFITHLNPQAFAGLPAPASFIGLAGFFLGLGNCLVLINVLSSAVDTVFVCYAADPGSLQRHRPEEYASLKLAWEGFAQSGGRRVGGGRGGGRGYQTVTTVADAEGLPVNVIRVQI